MVIYLCTLKVSYMNSFKFQIGGVDKFVSHVNATLRHKHDQERLNAIVAKIESYDAVESPNDECLKVSLYWFIDSVCNHDDF